MLRRLSMVLVLPMGYFDYHQTGKEGKPTITYTGNMGFSQPSRIPELANAFEYATMVNEIDKYSGVNPAIPRRI